MILLLRLFESMVFFMKEIKIWFSIINLTLVFGILYFILYKTLSFEVTFTFMPCILHDIVHIYCPGCGGTRALVALLNFNFIESFLSNPLVIFILIIFSYFYFGILITILKNNGKQYFKFGNWIIYGLVIILIFTGIIRNIIMVFNGYDYLGDLYRYWR